MSKPKESTPVTAVITWPEAVRRAIEGIPEPPPDVPVPPGNPEALEAWLPALVACVRRQMAAVARKRADRLARRGYLRGLGGREVARAMEEIGKAKEVKV